MGIRKYNPTSPGRRGATVSDWAELTPGAKPEKSLLRPKRKTGGRNNQGKTTARFRGVTAKYREAGYDSLILWEADIKRCPEGIAERIKAFTANKPLK